MRVFFLALKQKMKVLQLCSYYLGTNLYKQLFDALDDRVQHKTYVFCNVRENNPLTREDSLVISPCFTSLDRAFFHLKHKKVYDDIRKKVDVAEYEVLHAHSLFSNGYIAYQLFLEYRIPYIVAVRNTDVNVFFKWMVHLRGLGRKILKNATKVIFLSPAYLDHTIETYLPPEDRQSLRERSYVIPNGINPFWLENKYGGRKKPQDGKVRLIYVGELRDNKNIHTTISVCERLIEQGYDVSYHVIGRIVEEKYAGLEARYDFVTYTPYSPKEAIVDYYREADIFIMPSKYETFGLVYAEALSQALPVIYTRGQGFDQYFADGVVGYSTKFDNVDEMVSCVKRILADYEQIAANCVEKVDVFDWTHIAATYEELYVETIRGEKR